MPSDGHPMTNSVTLGGAAFVGDLHVNSPAKVPAGSLRITREAVLEGALALIASVGCMDSGEDAPFWCKADRSTHSIYCPAGIARKALDYEEPA